MSTRIASVLFGLAAFAAAAHSSAFCRATTCNPNTDACERDDASCLTTGLPLFWASSCLQVYVQADGAPIQGISFDTAHEAMQRAFTTWLSADCRGAGPSIDVQVLGPITCGADEYNATQKNANIVAFREDEWPYVGAEDALGFTHLRFDPKTGELWDADLEINAVEYQFSVGDPVTQNDLDSMLTHEAGHILGLAHTTVEDATMFASYTPGTDTQRTLAEDDVEAVCATYPTDRVPSLTSCSPRHGFSDLCGIDQPPNSATNEGTDDEASTSGDPTSKGCAFAGPASNPFWSLTLLAAALSGGLWRRRRVRHRFVSCGPVARRG